MLNIKILKSILSEYGIGWMMNRLLYSMKLKLLVAVPPVECLFEKHTKYPTQLDIFDINVKALRSFIQGLSEQDKKQLIETADKACNGIITGFSSVELDYGRPIDWQLNPLTGKCCDKDVKWFKIPDFDNKRGDIKVIWEISRFSHFITLTRAYILTADKKYYKAFSSQLKDWLTNNRYSYGANYKCGQECSIRMVNALLAFKVFRQCGIATDADASMLRDLVDRCYKKILSNFFYAFKCIKNNHTIAELMGMIIGAWCCNDKYQMQKAYKWLDKVIDEQFMNDGGYKQYSFNYQRLALQCIEVVMSVEKRTGISLSSRSKKKIKKSADLMYQCQDDTGDMPNYGNNDGALVFPVTSCGYRDFRPVINTVCALQSKVQLYGPGKHQEELLWFMGGKEQNTYPVIDFKRDSCLFHDAGLFTVRADNAWAMIVSNNYESRPAHMDQLHFDLWIDGINVLCDAGTFSYASEEYRKFVSNESHNTVMVKNAPQMNMVGAFMICGWTRREFYGHDTSCFISRTVSVNGYTHMREIKQLGDSFAITDKCDTEYTVIYHTPCDIQCIDGSYKLLDRGKLLCSIYSNGEITECKSERSLYYLKKDVINCLAIKGHSGTEILTNIVIEKGEK